MRYKEFAIEEKKTIASVVPVSADTVLKSRMNQQEPEDDLPIPK